MQLALKKHPELPDVPLGHGPGPRGEGKRVLELIFSRQSMGRPLVAPPGLDPAVVRDPAQGVRRRHARSGIRRRLREDQPRDQFRQRRGCSGAGPAGSTRFPTMSIAEARKIVAADNSRFGGCREYRPHPLRDVRPSADEHRRRRPHRAAEGVRLADRGAGRRMHGELLRSGRNDRAERVGPSAVLGRLRRRRQEDHRILFGKSRHRGRRSVLHERSLHRVHPRLRSDGGQADLRRRRADRLDRQHDAYRRHRRHAARWRHRDLP